VNPIVKDRTTGALDLIVQTCSRLNNCQPVTLGLVVDNNWRGVYYNLCYDPKKCDKVFFKYTISNLSLSYHFTNFKNIFVNQIPTVSEYKTLFGLTVSPSKTSLTLNYVAKAPGARIYLTTGPGTDRYHPRNIKIVRRI